MDDLLQKKTQGPLSTQEKSEFRDLRNKKMHRDRMRTWRDKKSATNQEDEATAVPKEKKHKSSAAPTKQDTKGAYLFTFSCIIVVATCMYLRDLLNCLLFHVLSSSQPACTCATCLIAYFLHVPS
jgi:hypothetical protein